MNTDCEAKFSTTTAPAQRRPRPERQRAPRRSIVHDGPARKRGLRPLPAGGRVYFEPDHRWERNGRAAGGEHVGMLEQQLELRRPLAECPGLHVEPLAQRAAHGSRSPRCRAARPSPRRELRSRRAAHPRRHDRSQGPGADPALRCRARRSGRACRPVRPRSRHAMWPPTPRRRRARSRRLLPRDSRRACDGCGTLFFARRRPPCLRLRSARYVRPIVILVQVLMGRNRFRSRRRGAAARRAKAGEPAIHEHERRSRHSACVPRPVVMDSGFALRAPRNDSSVSRPDRPARAARGAPAPRSRASRSAAPRAA